MQSKRITNGRLETNTDYDEMCKEQDHTYLTVSWQSANPSISLHREVVMGDVT